MSSCGSLGVGGERWNLDHLPSSSIFTSTFPLTPPPLLLSKPTPLLYNNPYRLPDDYTHRSSALLSLTNSQHHCQHPGEAEYTQHPGSRPKQQFPGKYADISGTIRFTINIADGPIANSTIGHPTSHPTIQTDSTFPQKTSRLKDAAAGG